jgi:hypothetical protein
MRICLLAAGWAMVASAAKAPEPRDRFFEWNTREPVPSTFLATPTNYAITANGKMT